MAVYTHISDQDLADYLAAYDVGPARVFKGIAEGVENSNFYLETEKARFILTLFEKRTKAEDLPWFLALTEHLAKSGFPCARAIPARDGKALRTLNDKPAVLVEFLQGLSPRRPSLQQCRSFGEALARMHLALADFTEEKPNAFGPEGWKALWQGRANQAEALQTGLAARIEADMALIEAHWPQGETLQCGAIHADLFPDNTFFIGETFTGAFDFYFACTDYLTYDLAICLNAWAFDTPSEYNYSKGAALLKGYQALRVLSNGERKALPLLMRGAALRFFLTRLVDWYDTPKDALVKPHNPMDYAARLDFHRSTIKAEDYGYQRG